MNAHVPPPGRPAGAAAVGMLADLDPALMLAVVSLRLWCDEGPPRLVSDFTLVLGEDEGRNAADLFAALCECCVGAARRPLMRHAPTCRCLGGDEACFARMIEAAMQGDGDEALMFAMLMVRGDHAPGVAAMAAQAGLTFRRIMLRKRTLH